jgi:DNA repair protein RadA/Sms
MSLLLAVMSKRMANLNMGQQDVYAKVAGGLKLQDPALDLTLALALLSSRNDKPVSGTLAGFGEIGLGGEVRPVHGTEIRLKELERLGFQECVLPARSVTPELRASTGLVLTEVESVNDLSTILGGTSKSPSSKRTKKAAQKPPF